MTKQFIITREFNAPITRVWDAWVNPKKFSEWFGPTGFKSRVKEFSLKTGGCLHTCIYNGQGVEMWGKFTYREIIPQKKLCWEHSFSDEEGNLTRHPMAPVWPLKLLTNVTFDDLGDKTRLTLTWEPLDATQEEIDEFERGLIDGHMSQGWNGTFAQLTDFLSIPDAPSNNGFVFDTNSMDWWEFANQKLKICSAPNGISFVLSEISPSPDSVHHIHEGFECIYILEGSVISNGETFVAGQGFIANKGSEHREFRTDTGAKFIVVNSKN